MSPYRVRNIVLRYNLLVASPSDDGSNLPLFVAFLGCDANAVLLIATVFGKISPPAYRAIRVVPDVIFYTKQVPLVKDSDSVEFLPTTTIKTLLHR